ncbi:MAG: hypothetical protein Q8L79_18245 [Methylobacter sp.]|uniref:hypothetical protein n=1 Tax=Methylobacter sp. TaxID=2051955 RepID=UPI00272F6EC2|nr:hypothetical protein [Methylobacter sp.]MDP1667049.1 hypothetical protein [Methylobacter sp.]
MPETPVLAVAQTDLFRPTGLSGHLLPAFCCKPFPNINITLNALLLAINNLGTRGLMMKMKFGWLNDNSVVETNSIIIEPIADFDNAISEVMNSSQHNGAWYYPPIVYKTDKLSPRVAASRFELPPTHCIFQINGNYDREFLEFIVVFFGWLHGLRLNPENWGYLIKTPIKQGELVDFARPRHSDMKMLIEKAEVFWLNNKTNKMGNLMLGALNWFSYTQSYEQIFERFIGQYSVFDTLHHIVNKLHPTTNKVTHAGCFEHVSNKLDLHYPSWINEITKIRNDLI